MEAFLIVIAMIALPCKAERTEVLPWIHAGWTRCPARGRADMDSLQRGSSRSVAPSR